MFDADSTSTDGNTSVDHSFEEIEARLARLVFIYNTSSTTSPEQSPHFLLHGRVARVPGDAWWSNPPNTTTPSGAPATVPPDAIRGDHGGSDREAAVALQRELDMAMAVTQAREVRFEAGANMESRANRRAHFVTFQTGQWVLAPVRSDRGQPLAPRFEGPYVVIETRDNGGRCLLEPVRGSRLVRRRKGPRWEHASMLVEYRRRDRSAAYDNTMTTSTTAQSDGYGVQATLNEGPSTTEDPLYNESDSD